MLCMEGILHVVQFNYFLYKGDKVRYPPSKLPFLLYNCYIAALYINQQINSYMYFNGTKCRLFMLGCLVSASAVAKDLKTLQSEGIRKPLCFVENKGQVLDENNHSRSDIQYKLSGNGVSLYVGNGQLHYQFKKVTHGDKSPSVQAYQMGVTLVGANANAKASTGSMVDYHETYYIPQVGPNGATASAYEKITYTNVYPNIDWVLYVKDGQVEYDFVVRPGGDPSQIKLKYDGATALAIAKDGSITAKTPMGDVTERTPVAFETKSHKAVSSRFHLDGNVVSFETGKYNGSLTIDPYLNWSTYFGGTNEDVVTAVRASATSGSVYITGYTASTGLVSLPSTVYQPTYGGGNYDAFVARYTSTGATVTWVTYIGGSDDDRGRSIAVGANIFVGGSTNSTDLNTTTGAFQPNNAGGNDMFLVSLNGGGVENFVTYLGGTGEDFGSAVTLDLSGNVYIAGSTESGLISTDGTVLNGTRDGLLAKFNGTGAGNNQWITYLGGDGEDEINSITLNTQTTTAFVAATGHTNSTTGLASSGSVYQPAIAGTGDAFLARYATTSASAPTLSWCTYLGGSADEMGNGVASDVLNNIYVTGNTGSSDGITSGISYTSTYSGLQDGYLMKFDLNGTKAWGTYFGGIDSEYAQGVVVDGIGNISIAGGTKSAGIASTGAYQTVLNGTFDAFVAKYNNLGQKIYSTYFGRSGNDFANAIAADATATTTATALIIAGRTTSPTGSGFATTGAASTTNNGNTEGFASKFFRDTIVSIKQPFIDTLLCPGTSFVIRDTVNYNFGTANNFRVQLSDASGSFAAPVQIGTVVSSTNGAITCTIPVGTTPGTGYRIRIVSTNPAFTSVDNNINIAVVSSLPAPNISANSPVCVGLPINFTSSVSYAVNGYNWSGPSGYTSTLQNPTIPSATPANGGTYTVSVTHANNCPPSTNTVTVLVNSFIPPTPTDSTNAPICGGSTLMLFANSNYPGVFTWSWTGPGGFTSTAQNPVIPSVSPADTGYYYVVDTLDGCPSARDSVYVTLFPVDSPNINITVAPNDTVCAGTTLHFSSIVSNAGFSPQFQWMRNSTPIVGAIFSSYASATLSTYDVIWCRLQGSVQCPDKPYDTSNQVMVYVLDNTPVATITAAPDTFVAPGSTVTITAVYAGTSISGFSWYVNNVLVPTATTPTLVLTGVTGNDTVRFEVLSNAICANLGVSNTIIIRATTAVANVSNEFRNIDLFPNPNNGSFTVKGQLDGIADGDATLEITNAIGQSVYSGAASVTNGLLNGSVNVTDIPAGVYMLRLNKDGAGKVFRFVKD